MLGRSSLARTAGKWYWWCFSKALVMLWRCSGEGLAMVWWWFSDVLVNVWKHKIVSSLAALKWLGNADQNESPFFNHIDFDWKNRVWCFRCVLYYELLFKTFLWDSAWSSVYVNRLETIWDFFFGKLETRVIWYVYIYMYTYIYMYIHIHIYICICDIIIV